MEMNFAQWSNYEKNRAWDQFVDWCEENGKDFRTEDFDAWCDMVAAEEYDRAIEARFGPDYKDF